jgi:CRP-like cAMP-binding protein
MMARDVTTILKKEGILANMEDEWLLTLSNYGEAQVFQPFEVLIHQGDMNDRLFIILDGMLEVFLKPSDTEIKLAEITRGECFGEISIFEPAPASATVRAVTLGHVWSMNVDLLQQFMDHHPLEGCTLLLGVNQQLSHRLRAVNETIRKHRLPPSFVSIRNRIKTGVH